jgi:anti-sigma regulatory factor (Ser/Thr protein kinase)
MAELNLWADYSHLSSIRRFVEEVGEDLGIPERALYELELAVDEACANVIEHGYQGAGGKIEIQIQALNGGVQVVIRDWGQPFDPESIPTPDVTAPLETRPVGGVGLFLMRKVMTQVQFAFDPQGGNTLTMTKQW